MAQIKKLQPGGKSPEKTTPKYGRLIQNGVEIKANDAMIDWLTQQGYYGEQMANNLRNGDDQYLDTDEQGVGWIRNISIENPDLKEKQQERTTRASRRLEGRRLNQARADIQRLAVYDYGKFAETPKAKTPYKWDTLVIDYNPKEDGTKEFSNNQVNFDIIKRLNDLKNGLVIPEDQEFKDYDRVTQHYNNVKDLLEGTITRMRAGKLTADDEDILAGLDIFVTAPKQEVAATKEELEKTKTEAITKGVKNWLSANLKLNDSDISTHSSYWTTDDSNELVATDELYKLIGGNKNYWFGPESPYKDYVLLNGKLVSKNLVDKNGKQTTFGKWWESSDGQEFRNKYAAGLWSDAATHMAFEGSDNTWQYVDPYTQVSPYLKSGMVYKDVSSHYDFDPVYEYVGAITKMDDPVNGELLPSYRDYAITKDGTLVDISTIGGRYTRPIRPSSRPTKLNVYTLNPNGNFREFTYQYIDGSGKTHDIIVTLDQNGRVVKLTEDGKDYNILDQDNWQNNGTDIWKTIKEYLDRKTDKENARKSAQHFQWTGYFQPGGKLKSTTENKKHVEQVSGYITDPTKPYSLEDWNNGIRFENIGLSDWLDITSLGLDALGLGFAEAPVLGEGIGYLSDIATFGADLTRDGYQPKDLVDLALNAGLTSVGLIPGIGTAKNAAKTVSKIKKLAPLLNGLFLGYGIVKGYQGVTDILAGNINTDSIRSVLNGVMALRGIRKNWKSHKLMEEYGVPKTKKDLPKSSHDLLDGLKKSDREAIEKEVVDALVKNDENLKTLGIDNDPSKSWFDGDKITNYSKAWESLMSEGKITDDIIKANSPRLRALWNNLGKSVDAAKEAGNTIWNSLEYVTTRANPSQYKINPELSDEAKQLLQQEKYWGRLSKYDGWKIQSDKKGGKIRKCDKGDEFDHERWVDWETDNIESMENLVNQEGVESDQQNDKMESRKDPINFSKTLPKLPWMTRIHSVPEFKPSGVIPAKKGPVDQALEDSRKRFQEGLQKASQTKQQQDQKVAGGGDKINWSSIGEGLIGNGARAAAYLTTHFTNKRVLDHSLNAIRSKYLGAMKSMPIQQPLQRYTITPMTSLFDKQRTEFRNASRQIAKNFADSKLQMAQFLATEDQIAKREDNLLNQISKHITDVDLANTQLRAQYAKDEQAIADYNRNLGGQQEAEESMAYAQHAQKQGDNFNKAIAEFRTDWNKYLAQKDQMDLYKNYQDIFDKYRNAPEGSKEKAEYANQIGLLTYLIKNGTGARNPITYGRSFT